MKLIYKVLIRASIGMLAIMMVWAVLFYFGMSKAVSDEVDDMLSDFSEQLIVRFLSGDELMITADGVSSQYRLTEISPEIAKQLPQIRFENRDMYIYRMDDDVPSRVMKTIFSDSQGRYYLLSVATPSFEKEDISESLLLWTSILYFCLLGGSIAIYFLAFYKSMRPFYALISWLDNYKIGQKNAPLDNPTDVKEFARLNATVERTMQRSEQVYEQQRQFIGNASHELQTPLAVCINRLEMLMEDESLSPQQMEAMLKILSSLTGMQKLNRTMLLLSKIENGQFPASDKVSFNALVDSRLNDYTSIYSHKQIHISKTADGDFVCKINEQLANVLVNNLLKNAFVHSPEKGEIQIAISSNRLTVGSGPDHEPLDATAIFHRFNQGRQHKNESSGLGLAIAKSVCEQSHLSLEYSFSNNLHLFTIAKL